MKNINLFIALAVLFFMPSAYANTGGIAGFAQQVIDYGADFWLAITEGVPDMFMRMTAWAFEAAVYLKFMLYLEGIKFSWGVAKLVLQDLSISQTLNTFAGALPSTLRAVLVDIRFFDAVNVILQAFVTRMVMRFF
ncbi:DUF2523 family protein [Shewanella algae]|uniref:DUF2523 family protein n=1 Tax=Shewanella algae TaxID=38313 RepID=UPI001AADB288|nr:DUF2523 family protein [Shewanella algae]QTE84363.1 DUF2523 domain-containing protein [Shewanella algae]QTE84372.1 DUF2523 domain-containing protein [Shewanella algae]